MSQITPRENLLRSFRCDGAAWIPVCPYLFPNENPTIGVPEALAQAFTAPGGGGGLAGSIMELGAYLGAEEYMLPVDAPAILHSDLCQTRRERISADKEVSVMSTPAGELRQLTEFPADAPALVTERYVKTPADVRRLTAYFSSLRVIEAKPEKLRQLRDLRQTAGDSSVLFCRTAGTPLGMCYRVYADFTDMVYMLADDPCVFDELFACMEEKYMQLFTAMLKAAPELDIIMGMDDTSTSLISPAMFEHFNIDLTNRRAELCQNHGRLYIHHSCGLLRNLLPLYRKTRMHGIDAFTAPPMGDVTYTDGRNILGPQYSIRAGLAGGLPSLAEDVIKKHVKDSLEEAKQVQHMIFAFGGSHLTFQAMELLFTQAQKFKHY